MDQVEYCARISVIRGVGFAALGIGLTMFALMYEPSLSLRAGAVMLGLARALKGYDPTLEQALRDEGYLTRDARKVERKKYGQPGARKKFQFSKR